jgi:dihydrofolate synthase/folylpolyglutamate synthase
LTGGTPTPPAPHDPALAQRLCEVEGEIFARRPEHAVEPTLGRISALATLLGDPQHACPVIHVAGTNGKTSTARMIETLLRARGLRTGLFTSPHLSSVRERIVVDGEPLPAAVFVACYDDVAPYVALVDEREPLRLSFFEVLTAMAFAAFADAPVDVAVIEVGLGGTWDATNIADGAVAVVTPVAIDHTRYLGSTIEEIAGEKAGIIKPGSIAILGQQQLAAAEVLLRRAAEVGAAVAREGHEFGVLARELAVGGQALAVRGLAGEYQDLLLPLFGEYQAGNAACALAAVEAFGGAGVRPSSAGWLGTDHGSVRTPEAPLGGVSRRDATPAAGRADPGPPGGTLGEELVREAFLMMTSPGRLEVVRRSPVVVVDSAHNPAAMAASAAAVTEAFSFRVLIAVLAISEDKDVPAVLDQLEPAADGLVVTRNSSDRSMDPHKLADLAVGVFGPDRVRVAARLDDAIEEAVGLADEAAADGLGGSGVLVTGSVVTAGDARSLLRARGAGGAGGDRGGSREGADPG